MPKASGMQEKSSEPVVGSASSTFSSPRAAVSAAVTVAVTSGSFDVSGKASYSSMSAGVSMPAAAHSPSTMRRIAASTCSRTVGS